MTFNVFKKIIFLPSGGNNVVTTATPVKLNRELVSGTSFSITPTYILPITQARSEIQKIKRKKGLAEVLKLIPCKAKI